MIMYKLKNIYLPALLLAAIPTASLAAPKEPKESIQPHITYASRIKVLTYDEANVYVIRTKYGYQTNIVFSAQEEIKTISVGDRSLWQLIPSGNRLYIRPLSEGITTNMTLITNKHSYEFDLKSVDKNDDSNIYVAKFNYQDKNPEKETYTAPYTAEQEHFLKMPEPTTPNTKASAAKGANLEKPAVNINNYNYTYSGADEVAPQQVYDNGKSTFINYKNLNRPLPQVYIVAGGREFLTTPEVRGSSLVINEIASEILVRDNGGEIRVYNEALNPR